MKHGNCNTEFSLSLVRNSGIYFLFYIQQKKKYKNNEKKKKLKINKNTEI